MKKCIVCGTLEAGDGVHENSAQHRCNLLVQKFMKSRKSFIKDRDGIEIHCKVGNAGLAMESGTYSVNCQPSQKITLSFTISNISKNDILIVGVTLGVNSDLFKLVDKNGMVFGGEPTLLPGKSRVPKDVLVHFESQNIGICSIPIIFGFTSADKSNQTVVIRDLELCVGDKAAMKNQHQKSVYTNIEIPKSKNIHRASGIHRNDMFAISKDLKEVFGQGFLGKGEMSEETKQLTTEIKNLFKEDVLESNYERFFHHLLWLEETQQKICLKKYNMENIRLTLVDKGNNQIMFPVPGLAEKRPSLIRGDMVFIRVHMDKDDIFNGIILKVEAEEICVVLCREFFNLYQGKEMTYTYDVRFCMNRIVYERMHFALSAIMDLNKGRIFPKANSKVAVVKPIKRFYNKAVSQNKEQKLAVEHIVAETCGIVPYMVFGPPGTGKTITIVEAILQVLAHKPQSKILVCTDSNTAADTVAEKLIYYDSKENDKFLLRANSIYRNWDTFPVTLCEYGSKPDCKYSHIMTYSIVVMTLSHAGKYSKEKPVKSKNGFTHLFIDEAGQCSEPSSLIPMHNLLIKTGLVVLSGDPEQLGPVCTSKQAKEFGLGMSLMERLRKQYPGLYNVDSSINHNYITMLKNNFRCHPDILRFSNKFFYNDQMQYCYTADALSTRPIFQNVKEQSAVIFHGVSSKEQKEGKSPSYYNSKEIELVQMYLKELLTQHRDLDIKQSDIGIITPYYRQMCKIKKWLEKSNNKYNDVEVGTVEAFQGREKRIIIITTVRANFKLLNYDAKYQLGFMVDRKRFNVALTRAKSKLIVIGNPTCLTRDYHWKYLIDMCIEDKAYIGEIYESKTKEQYENTIEKIRSLGLRDIL